MAGPSLGGLYRTAGWLALAYVIAIAGYCFWSMPSGEGAAVLFDLILIPWIAAPAVAAAAGAGASPDRLGTSTYLALEAGFILFTIWSVVDINLYGNSTAAIGILFLPVLEWPVLILVFLVALACGWRMRPDFLLEAPPVTPPPRV